MNAQLYDLNSTNFIEENRKYLIFWFHSYVARTKDFEQKSSLSKIFISILDNYFYETVLLVNFLYKTNKGPITFINILKQKKLIEMFDSLKNYYYSSNNFDIEKETAQLFTHLKIIYNEDDYNEILQLKNR